MRKLSELGMLSELEKASDSQNELDINRALMKIQYQLTRKMFINEEKAAFFVDALDSLYGLKTLPPTPPKPAPQKYTPPPRHYYMPSLPSPIACVAFALIIVAFFGIATSPRPEPTWTFVNGTLTISEQAAIKDMEESDKSPWYGKQKNYFHYQRAQRPGDTF